jgi:tetratricopeptide (TPR) repeat protein
LIVNYLVYEHKSMAHDVFISYSNKDKNVADAVCSILEKNGVRCWIAPRDITPGAPFAEAIIDGIKESKIFVLIFSSNSNQSNQVIKEVDRAVHHCLAIIPLRLEDVPMSKQLEYYVSDVHWLDALTPPLEAHISKLCKIIHKLLTIDKVETDDIKEAFRAEAIKPAEPGRVARRFKLSRILIAAVIVFLAAIFMGAVWLFKRQMNIRSREEMTTVAEKTSGKEITIVVLPFKNLTGKADQDYIVQWQNDALTTELCAVSQVKPLRVLWGQTANVIANSSRPIAKLAEEIKIDYLLEGSVFSGQNSVTLQLRLIKALPDEKLVWTKQFKSDISNSEKLYNDIAGQIVGKIGSEITQKNVVRLPSQRKINPETYAIYLRAKYNIVKETPEGLKKGIEYLNEVLQADPGDPIAYAWLAMGYTEIAHGSLYTGDALEKAEAAASQAYKLDTTTAEVYTALGLAAQYYLWKFDLAEKYFKKALALNPNSAETHYHYAWGLYWFGRMEEAIAEHELAVKYDPFNPKYTAWLGILYEYNGRYIDGLRECQKTLEIQKDYPVCYGIMGNYYLNQGKADSAIQTYKKLTQIAPEEICSLGAVYAVTGHPDETRKIIAQVLKGDVTPAQANGLANLYALIGDKNNAFKWLDHRPYHPFIPWTAIDPQIKKLLDGDPRYEEFLKRLNPPEK